MEKVKVFMCLDLATSPEEGEEMIYDRSLEIIKSAVTSAEYPQLGDIFDDVNIIEQSNDISEITSKEKSFTEHMVCEEAIICLTEIKSDRYLVEKCRTTDLDYGSVINSEIVKLLINNHKKIFIKRVNNTIDLHGWDISMLSSCFEQ